MKVLEEELHHLKAVLAHEEKQRAMSISEIVIQKLDLCEELKEKILQKKKNRHGYDAETRALKKKLNDEWYDVKNAQTTIRPKQDRSIYVLKKEIEFVKIEMEEMKKLKAKNEKAEAEAAAKQAELKEAELEQAEFEQAQQAQQAQPEELAVPMEMEDNPDI